MSDTPSEAFRQILLRVPAESLLRFRAVCKKWRGIIDDPSFIKSHTNNQLFSTNILIRNSSGKCLYSLSLDSLDFANGSQIIEATPVKTVVRGGGGVPQLDELPVASCNGLILISYFEPNKIWVIWNPLTRDFHELPELDIELRLLGSGFGYDCAADDYKVVRIDELYGNGKTVYRTLVYSLKMDSWKMIKNCPYHFQRECRSWESRGVFLNGALHWKSYDMIIKLDLNTVEYSHLPLPPVATKPGELFETYLDVLGGFLALSYSYEIELVGWILKEKAWVKLFSHGTMKVLRPLAYFKSKGKIVLQYDNKFILLDIERKSAKKVRVCGFRGHYVNISSQICPGSIFRLDENYDVCRRVGTKRTKAQRKRANARLKLCATTTDVWYHSYPDY